MRQWYRLAEKKGNGMVNRMTTGGVNYRIETLGPVGIRFGKG
jgi:hypothetical protein